MKMYILKFLLILFLFSIKAVSQNKEDKKTFEWRYEIECAAIGLEGTYLVKVYNYSKKAHLSIEQAKKNAVHGILFKGFPSKTGCQSQKPIASNPNVEVEKSDFFAEFFKDGGKYMKYVTLSTDGDVAAEDIKKVGKEYKIGIVVTVTKDALRRDMEAAGIIRGLSSGF